MFQECVSRELKTCLDKLTQLGIIQECGFYLAGGTGLALQLGHRRSDDLDFFSPVNFDTETVKKKLTEVENLSILGEAPGTLHLSICDQKVSFLFYPFKNMKPFKIFHGCPVADYSDIAAMKLVAISQRGAKKDFVDLHSLIKKGRLPLEEMIKSLSDKYPVRYNLCHIIKSIGYFEDAEGDAMPLMRDRSGFRELTDAEWQRIKEELLQEQKTAFKKFILDETNSVNTDASKRV